METLPTVPGVAKASRGVAWSARSLAAQRCCGLVGASWGPPSWSSYSRSRSRPAHAPSQARDSSSAWAVGLLVAERSSRSQAAFATRTLAGSSQASSAGLGRLHALLGLLHLALTFRPARQRGHRAASAAWTSTSAPAPLTVTSVKMTRSARSA